MGDYAAARAAHAVLDPSVVDTVSFGAAYSTVTVINLGMAPIYITTDGSMPAVGGFDTIVVPGGASCAAPVLAPLSDAPPTSTTTVRLICDSANSYAVTTIPLTLTPVGSGVALISTPSSTTVRGGTHLVATASASADATMGSGNNSNAGLGSISTMTASGAVTKKAAASLVSAASLTAAPTTTTQQTKAIVPLVVVDDADVGTGDTYPIYTGTWSTGTNTNSRNGSDSFINATGKVALSWTGGSSASGVNLQPGAGFETGSILPSTFSNTPSFSTTHAFEGTRSLALTLSAPTGYFSYGGDSAMQFALSPSAAYTASIYVWASGVGQARIGIETNTGTTYVGTLSGVYTTLTVGAWTRISATGTTAAGVNTGNIVVDYQGSSSGVTMWNDAVKVEAGSVPTTWSATGASSGAATTQAKLYGSVASHHGIGMVKVDGGTEVAVDQYAATRVDHALLWTSAALAAGQHTIEYRWSGTKNASSTGTTVDVDGFDLINAVDRVGTGTTGGGGGGTTTSGQPPITRSGTQLLRNGVRWKFAGVNASAFFGCAGSAGIPSNAQIDAFFASLNPHSVTRIWPYGGINDSFTVTLMDKLVASASAHGQYLAPTFFDSNPDQCGTQALNFSNPTANVNWAKALVARYAKTAPNDANHRPTNAIAFWECANEVSGDNTISWYQAMATGIKSVDPQTLVGSGSMPQYGYSSQANYEAAHGGAMDLICIHEYDSNTGMSGWADPAITAANHLNKPWYCGEDGFCCGGGDTGSKSGNATKLGQEWDAYIGNSTCAGMLYWSMAYDLGSTAQSTDISLVSSDAMWQKAQNYRHAYHGADSPTARYLGGNRDYNDATAYPSSIPLPGPTAIPSGVAVAAGASLQAAVNANPAGTTFILGAGTFTGSNTVVTPKAGDRFFGQGAGVTVLNGIAIRAAAGINSVTVANLSIHGVTWDGFAAIDSDMQADRAQFWQVLNCESYGNFQGINVGSGSTVTNNYAHDNQKTGFGGGANGSLIQYNAFVHNNPTNQADGGNKSGEVGNSPIGSPAPYSSGGASTVFANNYCADNGLAGYWSDVSGTGVQYNNNISVRNSMVGLMTEIDGGSNRFSGNLVAGNGFRNVDWQDDGILVSSSGHDTVTGNWAWGNRNADIQLYYQGRQGNEGANTVTSNVTSKAIAVFGSTPAGADTISGNTVVAAGSINPPSVICGPQV